MGGRGPRGFISDYCAGDGVAVDSPSSSPSWPCPASRMMQARCQAWMKRCPDSVESNWRLRLSRSLRSSRRVAVAVDFLEQGARLTIWPGGGEEFVEFPDGGGDSAAGGSGFADGDAGDVAMAVA